MRRILPSLAMSMMLASCTAPSTTTAGHPARSAAPHGTGTPGPLHSATPTPTPDAKTTAAPTALPSAALNSLIPAGVPTSLITGTLKMDAAYVIAAGGGNVIAAGGGNVIAAGGGNVIAAGGGNVIAAGGGNVIAAGGGNLIGQAGTNLIGQAGTNFRLLDVGTTATPITVAIGTVLPAAGMVVVPVSLETNVQIGDAVFTDEQGRYQVRVPQSTQGAFRLVAAVPGKSADDPWLHDRRLQYTLLSSAERSTEDNAIDEDTSAMTAFLTNSLTNRLADMMESGITSSALGSLSGPLAAVAGDLVQAMKDANTATMAPEKRDRLARKCVGIWLANGLDAYFSAVCKSDGSSMGEIPFTQAHLDTLAGKPKALKVLVDVMRDMRTRGTTIALAHPTDFESYMNSKPYVAQVLASRTADGDPLKGFRIRRPADVPAFAVYAYNNRGDGNFKDMQNLTGDPDMAYADPVLPLVHVNRASAGVADVLMLKLMMDPTKSLIIKAIRDAASEP